jgi:hypothetical protein
MSTRLIKKAPVQEQVFTVGQSIQFPIWVPLQNIGTTREWRDGIVVKVNRVTIDVQTAIICLNIVNQEFNIIFFK